MFPIETLVSQLTEVGLIDAGLAECFVADVQAAGRADRLFISITMMAVSAVKPWPLACADTEATQDLGADRCFGRTRVPWLSR